MNKKELRNKLLYFLLVFIPLAIVFFGCQNSTEKKSKKLPYIGFHDIVYEEREGYNIGDTIFHKVPEWNYLTSDSVWLSSSDVADKIWIVDFFFSYCPTICVPMNQEMKKVGEQLEELNKEVAFLSFSIDPDRDTPEILREYIQKQGFSADNWHFLTGDKEATYDLAIDGFQVLAGEDDAAPGGFLHSSNFVLVDKNRHIRGVYDGLSEEGKKQLLEDVRFLLEKE